MNLVGSILETVSTDSKNGLKFALVDKDELSTIITKMEAIVNPRSLGYLDSTADDNLVL